MNEEAYAKRVIDTGDFGSKPTDALRSVARYYLSTGRGKREVVKTLSDLIVRYDPAMLSLRMQSILPGIVDSAAKYPLIRIDSIPVTKEELRICTKLSGVQTQRLMFTLIVLAKYADRLNEKNNHWVNRRDKEIFSLANLHVSIVRQSLMLNDLKELGLIKFSNYVENTNVCVECLCGDGEIAVSVTDIRNLGNQYMMLRGGQFFTCTLCGAVVKRTHPKQKYCKKCAIEENRRKSAERWRSKVHGNEALIPPS